MIRYTLYICMLLFAPSILRGQEGRINFAKQIKIENGTATNVAIPVGALNRGLYSDGTNLNFSVANTERLRILSDGRLLLGTVLSGSKMTVNGGIGADTLIFRAYDSRIYSTYFDLNFWTYGARRMIIDASGRMTIGNGTETFTNAALMIGGGIVPAISIKGTNPNILLDGDINSYGTAIGMNGVGGSGKVTLYSDGANLSITTGSTLGVRLTNDFSTASAVFQRFTANGHSGQLLTGAYNAAFGTVYANSLNYISGTWRKITTNQYMGGLAFGASTDDTYLTGTGPNTVVFGGLFMQYLGANSANSFYGTNNENYADFVFMRHANKTGNAIYANREVFRIKDNGNLLINQYLEIEALQAAANMSDEGKGLTYNGLVNRFQFRTIPNFFNANISQTGERAHNNNGHNTYILDSGGLLLGSPGSGGKLSISNTLPSRTTIYAEGVAAKFAVDWVGTGENRSQAKEFRFYNLSGSFNPVTIDSTGIVITSSVSTASGLKFSNINSSTATTPQAAALGVDATGKVVTMDKSSQFITIEIDSVSDSGFDTQFEYRIPKSLWGAKLKSIQCTSYIYSFKVNVYLQKYTGSFTNIYNSTQLTSTGDYLEITPNQTLTPLTGANDYYYIWGNVIDSTGGWLKARNRVHMIFEFEK